MRLGLDFSRFGSCFSARKDIPCGVENRMLDKILFRRKRFSLFSSACYFDIWAVSCDFQQCGTLTCEDAKEPVQPLFKLRSSKWCSVSSLTVQLAKVLIRLRVCAGWSEALLVAHSTLLEISCRSSILSPQVFVKVLLALLALLLILSRDWTIKSLIRLRVCAGWSVPLLLKCNYLRLSRDTTHNPYLCDCLF